MLTTHGGIQSGVVNIRENKYSLLFSSRSVRILAFVVLLMLYVSCVFDPFGKFYGAKYLFFTAWLGFGLFFLRINFLNKFYLSYLAIFSFLLPVYGLLVGFIRGGLSGTAFTDQSYLTSSLFFLYSIFLLSPSSLVSAVLGVKAVLRTLSMVIVGFAILNSAGYADGIAAVVQNTGLAVISTREYGGVEFQYIYYVTSPMLVFLLAAEVWQWRARPTSMRTLLVLITATALFLSGTRANMAMAVFGVLVVVVWKRFGLAGALILSSVMIAIIFTLVVSGSPLLGAMVSLDDAGNSVKLGYLKYYYEIFRDPVTIFFGEGLNAHVWSSWTREMLIGDSPVTELTYVDLFRVFGLFVGGTIIFSLLYLVTSKRIKQSDFPWVAPGLFLYLITAISNPYLFSSNGMILIGVAIAVAASCNGRCRSV